jgi:GT2 family glycosyltransferase
MLSVVLVNYRSGSLIIDCLRTLHQFDTAGLEIIISDNSAGDGAKQLVLAEFPHVIWHDMTYNAGFSRANNAGIKIASGDSILLLNSDTLVLNNAVNRCYNKFSTLQDYAACGVQLLNADHTPQISGSFVMVGALNYLMTVPYVGRLVRQIALLAGVAKTNAPNAVIAVTDVHWINGAFLMVKRNAIEKAGLMDEDFFLYSEEIEWCSRIRKTGKLCVFGDMNVVHLEGQSSKDAFQSTTQGYSSLSDKKGYQICLSMFVRLRKELGVGWLLFHLFFHTLCIPLVILCAVIDSLLHPKNFSTVFSSGLGYSRNILRCWSFIATIIGGRPYFYKVL